MAHMRRGGGGKRRAGTLGTPVPSVLPDTGTTEFALIVLLGLELGALVWLRHGLRQAQGG
jgi:hypothetical protein